MRPHAQAAHSAPAPAGRRHRVRKTTGTTPFRRPGVRILASPRLLLGAAGMIVGLILFSAGAAFAYFLFTDSSSSAVAAAATLSSPTGAAESTSAKATSAGIPLSWTAPAGTPAYTPTSYVVLRCQGSNCTNFTAVTSGPCASVTTTSCTDTDPALASSTTYSYEVEAKLDNWVSAPSAALTASTAGAAELAFTTQPPASSQSGATFTVSVTVEDSNGAPVTNDKSRTVALAIYSGTGTKGAKLTCNGVSPKPTATTTGGVATFSGCSIDKAGPGYQLIASSSTLTSGTSSSFSITAGAPAQLAFTTQPSSSQAAGTGTFSATVTVEDSNGNPITTDGNGSVTLALTSHTTGATLSCPGQNTAPVSWGMASFTGCTIDKAANSYMLTAASGSLQSATSNAFNITPGTAAQLAFTTQPVSSTAGTTIPVVVAVQDSNGNTITSSGRTVKLAITAATNTSGATLGCNSAGTASGSANFGGCTVNKVGTGYTLTATSGSLPSATSNAFNITPGNAAQLAFITQLVSSPAKGTGSFSAPVTVEDSYGNQVTSDNGDSVTLALTSGTGTSTATLSCPGANAAQVSGGAATFTDCTIDKAGTYTLTATSGSLHSGTSNAFTITAGTAAALNIVSGNNQSATVSTAFANPLVVLVTDANGNPVSGVQVTFHTLAGSSGDSGTFAASATKCSSTTKSAQCVATTQSDGQATTSTLTANGNTGSYTIVATLPVGSNTLQAIFNEANNS